MLVMCCATGGDVDAFERHPEITTIEAAKAYVKAGWWQEGDTIRVLQKQGRVTPIIVIPADGEPCDVFGQFISEVK